MVIGVVAGAPCVATASGAPGQRLTSSPRATQWAAKPTKKATFGIGAADAKGLDGRPYLNYTTSPGAATSDYVAVRNYSGKPITLGVYAAAATSSGDGAIGFSPRSKPGVDANRWITFPRGARTMQVRLAPRQSRVLPISISVPRNASPGDHLVGVMASYLGHVVGKSGQSLNLEQRVALRALFRVSGAIRSQMSVEHLKVAYHGTLNPFGAGRATVTYGVRNSGNVLLSGTQRLDVTGVFGHTGAKAKLVRLPLMLPGASFPMQVEVQHVWPQLLLHARVTVTPLGVAGAVNPKLLPATASASFWAVPWTLLALIFVFAGLTVGGILWRRRLLARPVPRRGGQTKATPAVGEA
jgi:hypothetical protein